MNPKSPKHYNTLQKSQFLKYLFHNIQNLIKTLVRCCHLLLLLQEVNKGTNGSKSVCKCQFTACTFFSSKWSRYMVAYCQEYQHTTPWVYLQEENVIFTHAWLYGPFLNWNHVCAANTNTVCLQCSAYCTITYYSKIAKQNHEIQICKIPIFSILGVRLISWH